GVLPNGEMIAVKKLNSSIPGVKDKHFENEAYHLMRLKHPNVVLLVGWCSETENIYVQYKGKYICAEKSERLLCLKEAFVVIFQVLKNWRNRLEKTAGYTILSYQQIKRCIQIGLSCVVLDRSKRPPTRQIIKMLHPESSSRKKGSNFLHRTGRLLHPNCRVGGAKGPELLHLRFLHPSKPRSPCAGDKGRGRHN
ncbi:unnamed protein product, partial [Urochloa humidicola]